MSFCTIEPISVTVLVNIYQEDNAYINALYVLYS